MGKKKTETEEVLSETQPADQIKLGELAGLDLGHGHSVTGTITFEDGEFFEMKVPAFRLKHTLRVHASRTFPVTGAGKAQRIRVSNSYLKMLATPV